MKRYLAVAVLLLLGVVGTAQADNATTEAEAFKRLAAKALAINDSGPFGPKTGRALGLGENFLRYQIKVESGSDVHYFNLAKDGSNRVALASRTDGVGYVFLLDAQQRATAAAMNREGTIFSVSIDSIRPQLHQMIAFWIEWAGKNAP